MSASAVSRTLATLELLELIISHLPERSILLAQRVCKSWQQLISTSPTLQTALYFRAPSLPKPNSQDYTLNPIITSAFPFLLTPDKYIYSAGLSSEIVKVFQNSDWVRNAEAWKRKEASWRKMFISTPLVRRVVYTSSLSTMVGSFTKETKVWMGKGGGCKERGWINRGYDDEAREMNLEEEEGLRWGFLHDLIYGQSCTGYMLEGEWTMTFSNEYAHVDDANDTPEHGSKSPPSGFGSATDDIELYGADYSKDDEYALTLRITIERVRQCVNRGQEPLPVFKSEAYESVEFGPWSAEKHHQYVPFPLPTGDDDDYLYS